ncbi:MAG TPA: alternative ribosome rescue aminoacyl-tRNA hydrolase ArfB [Solirubrobacterales bacterium]|jgi:ribosome-associated protein|nr:alternative ribosome rescue aminoacyl-tRNA hydrolase ArfB [Solirubrobacterales bacterium]
MNGGIDIGHGIEIPIEEIELRASRSGGPGGQHANKTASRIEASFDVRASPSLSAQLKDRIAGRLGPRVTAVSQDTRGQARNREIAVERLRRRLADAAAPRKHRRATGPGRAAREKRLQAKRRQSERKRQRRRPAADD